MSTEASKLTCYNRGCGQTFDPANNSDGESSRGK